MKISLQPILRDLQEIYEHDGQMDRFNQYIHLMTHAKGEILPLGDFSPMGKRQKDYIDLLIASKAETFADSICQEVAIELDLEKDYKAMLVIVDEPKNGWTQRYLTDAQSRFSDHPQLKKARSDENPTYWIPIYLWTTDGDMNAIHPSNSYISQQVRSYIYRTFWQSRNGFPNTLATMIEQEAEVLKFSEQKFEFIPSEIKEINMVIKKNLNSKNYAVNFSAMYGDKAAESVGYEKLGLPDYAGFIFAQQSLNQ